MEPIGPLIVEHRLIERFIELVTTEIVQIKKNNDMNPFCIDIIVDCFRTYADRTHHGKEEDILFKALETKQISEEDRRIMNELIGEHIYARKEITNLFNAKEKFVKDGYKDLNSVIELLEEIIRFYLAHIEKEDKHFFFQSMNYFNESEKKEMLQNFFEFDKRMIHEKYKMIVEKFKMSHE